MADWQKLIAHLDERGENQVRLAVDEISEIVGEMPNSAWFGPTQKHYLDYWRSGHVLPTLKKAGWTVDFTDYVQQNIGFCGCLRQVNRKQAARWRPQYRISFSRRVVSAGSRALPPPGPWRTAPASP